MMRFFFSLASNQNKKPINNETNETISNTTVLSTTVIYKTEKCELFLLHYSKFFFSSFKSYFRIR